MMQKHKRYAYGVAGLISAIKYDIIQRWDDKEHASVGNETHALLTSFYVYKCKLACRPMMTLSLLWRHNGRDGVSNHQHHECLFSRLFRRRSKKIPELRVTGLCAGNSPVTGEFPTQKASNAENVSIWWRHHGYGNDSCFALSDLKKQPTCRRFQTPYRSCNVTSNDRLLFCQHIREKFGS